MSQLNGVQLNSSLGRDFNLLYGHILGNDISTDAGITVNSDKFNSMRASFQDTKPENTPQQFKNIVTDNNVGKRLDLSV